ncbi:MAG: FecR domain-containing protein, partial [Elusimicrobiales bacterium]
MSLLYVFLFLKSLSFSQNVNIEDYRKMIEEALSRQQGDRGGRTTEFRIERVGGSVEILSMGGEKAHLSNNYQYPLEVGDIIRVGYDGEANIYINNIGVIKVLRNTEFEISETQGEDILSLNYGSIVSRIERFKNSYTFKVKTPSAICNIKGTQFAIEHNKLSRESIFGVIDEGEIEVYAGENESENNVYK